MRLLEGTLVLDLTDLMGQLCGKLLSDLGAEVVKVEPPGGDPVRRLGPFKDDLPQVEGSLRFAYLNAGKRSLTLDLEQARGRDLLLRLVDRADVALVSGQPARLEARGLDPAALRARSPRLVVTAITGFGLEGPYRDYLCPDMVGFAMGGLQYISGDERLPPVKAPETQGYYFACVYAALGTLLALWQRRKDGEGRVVDVSVYETIASQEHLIRAFGFDGYSIQRHGSQHAHVAPASIFPTQDGFVYLFVSRQHWRLLLDLWPDHPPELDEPSLEANHARKAREAFINEHVSAFTRRFTSAELVDLLQRHGVPTLPVNRPTEFMRDPQVVHRQLFRPTRHPWLGDYLQVAFPVLMDGQRQTPQPPPMLGEHTRAILQRHLELESAEVELLFAQGVV